MNNQDVQFTGPRHIDVGIYERSSLGDDAAVVQIDTNGGTGRLRIILNDGEIWDADPENYWAEFNQHNIAAARSVKISDEVAASVLDVLQHGNAGSFATHFVEAILHADVHNFEMISRGAPEWCAAVMLWREGDRGREVLRGIAG